MSNVIGRSQCPQCKDSSRDNLVEYDSGSSYCFACGYWEGEECEKGFRKMDGFIQGTYKELINRGISKNTCNHFDYMVGVKDGKTVHIENYRNKKGEIVAQKYRGKDKDFTRIVTGKLYNQSDYKYFY